ncbi:MAG: hypothetical protein LBP24_00160 [Coriobacteriales bacterium]|jgi:hypothetical protein|nr:hypothetical protein [Coriobacteriales bacterium]
MNDDALLTLLFWLSAIVLVIIIYLVPATLVVIGALLLKNRTENRVPGVIMLTTGVVLCFGVLLWKILDLLNYGLT